MNFQMYEELNNEISAESHDLITAGEEKFEVEKQIEAIELVIKDSILSALNDAGKPIYTNDSQRQSAIKIALSENEEWRKLQAQKEEITTTIASIGIKLERLRHQRRGFELEVEYETALMKNGLYSVKSV